MVLVAHCSCGCGPALSPPHPQHTHTLPPNLHFGSSLHMVHGRVKGGDNRKSMSRMEPHHTTTGPKTALVGLSRQIPYRGSFKDTPPPLAQALGVLTTMPGLCGSRLKSAVVFFFFSIRGKKRSNRKKCPPITGGAASPDRSEAPNPITRDFRAQPCTGSCD